MINVKVRQAREGSDRCLVVHFIPHRIIGKYFISKSYRFVTTDRERVTRSRDSDDDAHRSRTERERREIEECKKKGKNERESKEKKNCSPVACKKQKKKGKDSSSSSATTGPCAKFSTISSAEIPPLMNTLPKTFMRQENSKLSNMPLDHRSYSTLRTTNSDEFDPDSVAEKNFWSFNDNDGGYEELPVPVVIENDDAPEDNSSSRSGWLFSWFNQY